MRTRHLMLAAASALLLACATIEPSRTLAGPQPEATKAAQRAELKPRIEEFVNEVTALEHEEGLPRWNHQLCPQVTGLSREEGEFILARISEVGRVAGVPLAGERCGPNLYVFVTTRPKELLQGMKERNSAFAFGVNAAPAAVDEFIGAPRAVKVWYNTATETAWGPEPIEAQGLFLTAPVFSRVFVIVDGTQLRGVALGQLADYVAMAGLAEVNPAARVGGAQTILQLFAGSSQAAPAGMTDWDRAFLKSLYATEQSGQQRAELASSMVREIIPDPIEEVIVRAHLEKLSKLQQEIEKSEDAFYKAYNKVNAEPEYQIHCGTETRTEMRKRLHVCKPQFIDTANEDETQGFFLGYAAIPAAMVIAAKMPAYRKHLREVVEKNPKLIAVLRDYYLLNRHYEAVRKEKFKGRWIVWD